MLVVEAVPYQVHPSHLLLERLEDVGISKPLFLQKPSQTSPNRTQNRCSSTRQSHPVGECGVHPVLPLSSIVYRLFRLPHSTFRISMWGFCGVSP
jgi:hypothetical protein